VESSWYDLVRIIKRKGTLLFYYLLSYNSYYLQTMHLLLKVGGRLGDPCSG